MGTGIIRATWMVAALSGSVMVAGAAGAADPPAAPADPQSVAGRGSGTWGACGSWWEETATQTVSGSVCGVDGVVVEGGRPTQLAEPLISVSRYVCSKATGGKQRGKPFACTDESYNGTLRRTEMTVDPLLRAASIRGALGGCVLDVEFAGVGPAQPQGNVWESHGLAAGAPQVSVGGGQTFTSQARWWGGVCGHTVVATQEGQAWLFRGVEASLGGGGEGCCEGE